MVKLYFVTIFFFIDWRKSDAENNTTYLPAPRLDFWSPDPKFDTRKLFGSQQNKLKEDENENKIYYKHTRPKFNERGTETHDKSQKFRAQPVRGDAQTHSRNNIRLKKTNHKLGTKDDSIRRRPRILQIGNFRDDDIDPSTRMTPMYLMQQPQEAHTTTQPDDQTHGTRGPEPEKLRPYSLEFQIRQILAKYPEVNVSIEVIGRTVEYNNILLVKMSEPKNEIGKYFRAEESKYIEEIPEKKIIFLVHGLTVMGLNYLAILNNVDYFQKLLSYYIAHLDKFDIFLVPMANPDGYASTFQRHIWNKNLSPQNACPGVALDRNFDVAWSSGRTISSSCSQLYPGPEPFSEAETRAIRDVFHNHGHKIAAYIHVHSGSYSKDFFKGDAVLYPKGYTEVQSDDDKYIDLRAEIDEAIRNASFQVLTVTVDTLHNWYGKVSGSSVDYASTIYGIPYSMEFVMQIYNNDYFASESEEKVDHNALTEVWRRVIDVVFNNIYKNMQTNDVNQ